MRTIYSLIILLFPFLCFSQAKDTSLVVNQELTSLSGMYKSNSYKRNIICWNEEGTGMEIVEAKPRVINDFIFFIPYTDSVRFNVDAWSGTSCKRQYKDMFFDSMAVWIGKGTYEIKNDSVKIYRLFTESNIVISDIDSITSTYIIDKIIYSQSTENKSLKKKLLYKGVISNNQLILKIQSSSIVYPKNNNLIFSKCPVKFKKSHFELK
jgi:hypothetical protein